jgi:hypothetical protein
LVIYSRANLRSASILEDRKIESIPLWEHLVLLTFLEETIGGGAGSSAKENLLHRIYMKWRAALPNLEEAPLFKMLGRKKKVGEGTIEKIHALSDAEKDRWANLFGHGGSEEKIRPKFAIETIRVGLNKTSIILGSGRTRASVMGITVPSHDAGHGGSHDGGCCQLRERKNL